MMKHERLYIDHSYLLRGQMMQKMKKMDSSFSTHKPHAWVIMEGRQEGSHFSASGAIFGSTRPSIRRRANHRPRV